MEEARYGSCLLCTGASSFAWCGGCHRDLLMPKACCSVCGLPLAAKDAGKETGNDVCGRCLREPPVWDQCRFLYPYRFPANLLIRRYKYSYRAELAWTFARYFAQTSLPSAGIPLPEVLLPVPLHWTRQIRRGFNQAQWFAQKLSSITGVPCDTDALWRQRRTQAQVSMSQAERKRNLRKAFRMRDDRCYRHVALVDDVVTTGATAKELASLLKRHGARRVELWVIARA